MTEGPSKELMERHQRALNRIDVRLANALRVLGIKPGEDNAAPDGQAEAHYSDGVVHVSSPAVSLAAIARAAVLAGATGETPIHMYGRQWGVLNLKEND